MADGDDLYHCEEKRRRLDVEVEQERDAEINFDVVFNESIAVFADSNKTRPGSFTIKLYCRPEGSAALEDCPTFSLYQSKIISQVTAASTARRESLFFLGTAFNDANAAFFVDIDLGFSLPVVAVEVKDSLAFGHVTAVSAGISCLGNHNHWSFSHWRPCWSRQLAQINDNNAVGCVIVPEKFKNTPVGVLRFEMSFVDNKMFYTDLNSYVRMSPNISTNSSHPTLKTPATPLSISSGDFQLDRLPCKVVAKIVDSLKEADRLKALLSLSGTCQSLRRSLAKFSSLYETLDLTLVPPAYLNAEVFNFFAERATAVRHMRTSWLPHEPEGVCFYKFLRNLPPVMETFVAEACPFVDDKVLQTLSESQPNLETLDLTRCLAISPDAFRYLMAFSKLRRISLQQTNIGERPLCQFLSASKNIQVLNLASLVCFEGKFGDSTSACNVFQSLSSSPLTPNLLALKINQLQVEIPPFTDFVANTSNMREFMCMLPDFYECNWNSAMFSSIASSWGNLNRLSISELPIRKYLTNRDFLSLVSQLRSLRFLFVVPTDITVDTLTTALEKNNTLTDVVLSGRKIAEEQASELSRSFPSKNISYVNIWLSGQQIGAEGDGNVEIETESSSSDGSDTDDDNSSITSFDSMGSRSSVESKNELEVFQEETRASMTTLVTSVRDRTNTVEDVRTMLDALLSKRTYFKQKQLQNEIRYTMATAIFYRRFDVLSMLLDRCPARDLADVLMNGYCPLLNFAIKLPSLDGVRLLLEHGALPNPSDAMSALGTAVITVMDRFDDDDAHLSPNSSAVYCEIIKLLFAYNADPLFFHPHEKGTNALHYIACLAGHSPQLANTIIENTPGTAYFSQEIYAIRDSYDRGPSPLASIFDMIDVSDPIHVVKNMVRHALLPLLRYGAPYLPDDIFSNTTLPEVIAIDHFFSAKIWQRPNVLAEILMEARRSSSLNVHKLMKILSPRHRSPRRALPPPLHPADNGLDMSGVGDDGSGNDSGDDSGDDADVDVIFDDETGELMMPFARYIMSRFPRPLQNQCRTIILSKLPHGPSRVQAIKSLNLPKSLISYLDFGEFDLPIIV